MQNTSLLEFDDVQQWRWQGPYTWQKGDFYTRTVVVPRWATQIWASNRQQKQQN